MFYYLSRNHRVVGQITSRVPRESSGFFEIILFMIVVLNVCGSPNLDFLNLPKDIRTVFGHTKGFRRALGAIGSPLCHGPAPW